jgi:hypothetical protein
MNSLVINSEGSQLEIPASRRTFNIKIVLKNLAGEGVVWIHIVLNKGWRTVVKILGFCKMRGIS